MYTFSNLLSLCRILLTPLTIIFMLFGNYYLVLALILFTIASITDFFDGYLARKYKNYTTIGAFLDPFADKILVLGTFFAFYLLDVINLWMVVIIGLRDIVITLLRTHMAQQGITMTTSWSAKWKTTIQFIAIYTLFFYVIGQQVNDGVMRKITEIFTAYSLVPLMMYGVIGFTVWTGVAYVINKKVSHE